MIREAIIKWSNFDVMIMAGLSKKGAPGGCGWVGGSEPSIRFGFRTIYSARTRRCRYILSFRLQLDITKRKNSTDFVGYRSKEGA